MAMEASPGECVREYGTAGEWHRGDPSKPSRERETPGSTWENRNEPNISHVYRKTNPYNTCSTQTSA